MRVPACLLLSAFCCLGPCAAFAKEPDAKALEFFEKRVRPVLVGRCYRCHAAGAKKIEGGLQLDSREAARKGGESGPAVVPGKPEESLLIQAVRYGDDFYKMPPDGKLPAEVIADLEAWVRGGAADPRDGAAAATASKTIDFEEARKFWAFQPPVEPVPPAVHDAAWCRSPLDRFLLSQLEAGGLKPAPEASRRAWIRRATYDLTGLPPTPEEVAAFLADDAPDAHARVVDRLLASPRYGERWGRHWLDVARYADSNGLDENLAYAYAFRYRDYAIAAFNDDKPYDRFVQEQLAGDLLPPRDGETDQERNARRVATGFLALGPKMLACDDGRKMELDIIDEQVSTLCRAFMGLTMGCARCHDHKFDPLPTGDYYALAGIFKSTRTMENFKVVAQWHEYELPTAESRAALAAYEGRVKALAARVDELTAAAQRQLLEAQRAKAGAYLRAAAHLVRSTGPVQPDGQTSIGELVDAAELTGRGVLLEAEKFDRGTLQRDTTKWGKGVGVLLQSGYAEYDLRLPPGRYQFELRYAAQDARPVEVLLNGKLFKRDAAGEVTGGWYPDRQKWHFEGVLELPEGPSVLRLARDGVVPHIDKLLLIRLPAENERPATEGGAQPRKSLAQWAAQEGLSEEFLKQWVAYLRAAEAKDDSPWHGLLAAEDGQLEETIKSYAGRLDSAPFRAALLDEKDGPFRLPARPERFYAAATQAELKKATQEKAQLEKNRPAPPRAMGVTEGKAEDLQVHIRGNYLTLGDPAPRRFPRVLSADETPEIGAGHSGRLELARWLTRPEHPLTARVMANRIWLWHFGEGLVRTPDNFGRLGERPTNGPLLDWLAVQFVRSGWSVKAMHRLIMLSSAYRMSTRYDAAAAEADPENRLWWRFNRRRLEAEEIRDSLLALGGSLDLTMYGQLMPDANRAYVTGTGSKEGNYDFPRRSVYLPILRSAVYNVLQAFDFPDPAVLAGRRAPTTVAPQALFMMNGGLVQRESRHLAAQLLALDELGDAARVQQAYARVFGRPPNAADVERALQFIGRYAQTLAGGVPEEERRLRSWQGLCRVLLASSEFLYVE